MKVGIIQPLIGSVGGNDTVLRQMLDSLKDHDVTLFTFSKPDKDYNCKVVTKLPIKIPMFGIYQNALMPNHNLDGMDIIISNSYVPKTSKPCIVYDQNHLANDFNGVVSEKYQKGFWKYYAIPYKLIKRHARVNQNARYYGISDYSSQALQKAIGVKVETLYPGVPFQLEKTCYPKEDQVCILGRIAPEKNLEMAIEIANQYGGLTILAGVVQKANNRYLEKLKGIANTNVIIIPNPSRHDFMKIMSESKVILSASKETLGLTQIEGINHGCVPVVPDNSAHQETVPFLSLRYWTVSGAVDKINRVMSNEGLRESLAKRLHEYNIKFDPSLFSKRLNTVIDEMKT